MIIGLTISLALVATVLSSLIGYLLDRVGRLERAVASLEKELSTHHHEVRLDFFKKGDKE